ncbi:DinB family protein [Hyunsoonleella aestuarii]|nr:DinB family protein [Hyunsoonleella aestuarii]
MLLISCPITQLLGQQSNDNKKIALDILTESIQLLESNLGELKTASLSYKPKDNGWTILNCLEHLAIVEKTLNEKLKEIINSGKIDLDKNLSSNDWLVIAKITDRTNKVNTPAPFRPKPEFKDKSKEFFLNEIKTLRKDLIVFLSSTKVDLRHVFAPYIYGEADAIQHAVIIGAHMHRHTMQIQEILEEEKANN